MAAGRVASVIDDLYGADLNLLVVFAALMRDRNVTRCATRLAVGQSTVSASLGRLRILFQDPLFIRAGREMRPTDKAMKLAHLIAPALELIDSALIQEHAFSPAACQESFRIVASGGLCVSWVLNLCSPILAHAPGIALSVNRTEDGAQSEPSALSADFLEIGYFPSNRPGMECETLLHCRGLLLRSRQTPVIETMADLASRRHVLVPFGAGKEVVLDRELGRLGLARHVVVSLPTFDGACELIAGSDLVLILPDIELLPFAHLEGLAVQPLPPDAQISFELRLAWPIHQHTTAGQRWFRNQIRQQIAECVPLKLPATGL
jgi:LysR family transcriptional activator of mexEF-oprN operon